MLDNMYQVVFNENRLDNIPGVDLYNHDATRLPDRDIKIYKLARRSKSIITSAEYTQKSIPAWMDVCSGGRSDTEETLTFIKSLLQAQNGTLRILQAGLEVEYTATMNEFNVEWEAGHAYVEIVFIASDPIGISTSTDTLFSLTGVTTSSTTATFVVDGTFNAEPIITVVVNTVTGGTGQSISLINSRTNQGITITADFANGDILQVDTEEYEVLHNGVSIDFEGLFPIFPAGSQQLAYSDTFTTRNVDITGTYNQRV